MGQRSELGEQDASCQGHFQQLCCKLILRVLKVSTFRWHLRFHMFMWFGKLALNISLLSWMSSPRIEDKCFLLSPLPFHHNQHADCFLSFQRHPHLFCIFRYLPWKTLFNNICRISCQLISNKDAVREILTLAWEGRKEKAICSPLTLADSCAGWCWNQTGGSWRLGPSTVQLLAATVNGDQYHFY